MTDSGDSTSCGQLGAIPHAGGVRFWVWAPHAEEVHVAGTFNDWSQSAHSLVRQEGGVWSTDVPEAKPGDEYKYVIHPGGLWRGDPYARALTGQTRNSVICDPAFDWGPREFRTPPRNECVIYEMHLGTFNDRPGGPPEDLRTAIDKLPYVAALGVNALQIMPPMEVPGGFSWGYNPEHLFAIAGEHGGPDAFKEFVKGAHANGLSVIFPLTYSHLACRDLWQFDGWHENDKGGIYYYNDARAATPWGDTRPDYGCPEVQRYLLDNARMWLAECRVDGLHWTNTAHIRNVGGNDADLAGDLADGWRLVQRINDAIRAEHPQAISIAEDLRNNPWLTKATGVGGAGFHSQWDVDFAFPVREAIITPQDSDRNLQAVGNAVGRRFNKDPFARVIYTESHHEYLAGRERIPTEIWPGNADSWYSKKRSALGAVLVFTSPGIPMICQGQEFLEDAWFNPATPFDWGKTERFSGILRMYRDLIRLRRNQDGTTRGLCGDHVDVHHIDGDKNIIAYHRWDRGGPRDSVVVVLNMANGVHDDYPIGLPRGGLWKVRFDSDEDGYDPDFESCLRDDVAARKEPLDEMPCRGTVRIGPYSALILSQDE